MSRKALSSQTKAGRSRVSPLANGFSISRDLERSYQWRETVHTADFLDVASAWTAAG